MKTLAQVYLLIGGFLLFYSAYLAVQKVPSEGDSLAYHLPIAQNILAGHWVDFERPDNLTTSLLQYYPASSHLVLAVFVWLHLPMLFNIVGVVALVGSIFWVARALGLPWTTSAIVAITVSFLTAPFRLLLTQTIDIWLAVWYTLALGAVFTFSGSNKSVLGLGLSLGMLVGTKFTGPFFALGLCVATSARLIKRLAFKRLALVVTLVLVVGGSWYLRNLMLRGDLFYPASHPAFHLDEMYTWQNFWRNPSLVPYAIQSLGSEYSFWWLTVLLAPIVIWKRRSIRGSTAVLLAGLTLYNAAIHLLLPAAPVNLLSDLRYALPTLVTGCLMAYLVASRWGYQYYLAMLGLIPLLSVFPLRVAHQPKVFLAYAALVAVVMLIWKKYGTRTNLLDRIKTDRR